MLSEYVTRLPVSPATNQCTTDVAGCSTAATRTRCSTLRPPGGRVRHTAAMYLLTALLLADVCGAFTVGTDQCPTGCQCDWQNLVLSCINSPLEGTHLRRIKRLSLRGTPLPQHLTLQTLLKDFKDLEILDLADMQLDGLSEYEFSGLPYLRELHLDNNQLNSSSLEAVNSIGSSLNILTLRNNSITALVKHTLYGNSTIEESILGNLINLVDLDMSMNAITNIPHSYLAMFMQLQSFNISYNHLQSFTNMTFDLDNRTDGSHPLRVLDLSFNSLHSLDCSTLSTLAELRELRLQHNGVTRLQPYCFTSQQHLRRLDLSSNPFISIPDNTFYGCTHLQHLTIDRMSNLMFVDYQGFNALENLQVLSISHNPHFGNLHVDTFLPLTSLMTLDLSFNGFSTIFHPTFLNLTTLNQINLDGNPWLCDCEAIWLHDFLQPSLDQHHPSVAIPELITCANPQQLAGVPVAQVPTENFTCFGATIVNHTDKGYFKIGQGAILNCDVKGSPTPTVTWLTPSHKTLRYQAPYVNWGKPSPHQLRFHKTHHWHAVQDYFIELPHQDHMHVLKNGSLYIDYVQRTDAGHYRCIVHNDLGNDTIVIEVQLNYMVIQETYLLSLVVGFCSSACFFVVGLITAALRYAAHKCSREQRQRRKSIRQILEGVDACKTHQFGKLSAFKSAKIDQLSAFKSAKVDQLRSYKNVTLGTLVHYLERLREHYSTSVKSIKDNCTNQADKLRDNYATQMDKFKDFRSHQVDKMRENYNCQVLKIRDYGSVQLERLREQYKMQQNYVLKIIELLDIGNCMAVVEAECLKTESMLFDPSLHLDLDTHPVHILFPPLTDSSDSEYETAGSHPDVTGSQTVTKTCSKPSHKRHRQRQKPTSTQDPTNPSSSSSKPKHKHKRKKHRHKRCKHVKCLTEGATRGNDEAGEDHNPDEATKAKKRSSAGKRKVPVPKQLTNMRPLDGAGSDFQFHEYPRSMREMSPGKESSVYMTGQSEHSNTEYESAKQSRDQTPEADNTSPLFASLPSSTPSTPTLTLEDHTPSTPLHGHTPSTPPQGHTPSLHTVLTMDPDLDPDLDDIRVEMDSSETVAKESSV